MAVSTNPLREMTRPDGMAAPGGDEASGIHYQSWPPRKIPGKVPRGFPVDGRPNSNLMRELRWYLEDFVRHEARYVHGARAPTAGRRAVSLSP